MNAVRLLNTTDKKVSEIAQETGFSDESRFIACFKEYYQQTPGYYRKQIKSI